MGPLPHATNGHKLLKHFSHCTIPSPHQNTSCHSVANLIETPSTSNMSFCPLHFRKQDWFKKLQNCTYTRWTTRNQHVCNLHVYNLPFNFHIMIFWIWFMIFIFGISYGNSRIYFTIQIILWYFWIWFLWYFIFTFMWNFTIRVPCLGSGRAFYLIWNTLVLLKTWFMVHGR